MYSIATERSAKSSPTNTRVVHSLDRAWTQDNKFAGNSISTTKYSALVLYRLSFFPLSLLMQFTRISNVYYLILIIFQIIPFFRNGNIITYILHLVFVVVVSMVREGYEDIVYLK